MSLCVVSIEHFCQHKTEILLLPTIMYVTVVYIGPD